MVTIAIAVTGAWPAQVGADTDRPTLRVTPTSYRLHMVSPAVRDAARSLDSDADADELWGIYQSVALEGEAALIRWALELQATVRDRKGNYLHALYWIFDATDSSRAREFAEAIATRGIAIGPDSGHYECLDHLDATAPLPDVPADVGDTPVGQWVDDIADARYHLSYRPAHQGQLSRLIQVSYADGTQLDIDIRRISDNYDPAHNQSMARMYLGPAGRLYPLRMNRVSTPNLWAAKHAALDHMRQYNQEFEALVTLSTSATMTILPVGLAVRVQSPRAAASPRGKPPGGRPLGGKPPGASGNSSAGAGAGSQGTAAGKPPAGAAGGTTQPVTGRVATRINLADDKTRFTPLRQKSGEPVSAGWKHLVQGHYTRSVTANRSIFTIPQHDLRVLLQSKTVVQSPVTAVTGGQYVRTVDVGRTIGIASLKRGGGPTGILKVFTDEAGNLITAFPY